MCDGLGPQHRSFHLKRSYGGLPPPGQGSLLDIGSGVGKQVFTAACLWPWKRVCGIEIYEKRHRLSVQALARWNTLVLAAAVGDEACQAGGIRGGEGTAAAEEQEEQGADGGDDVDDMEEEDEEEEEEDAPAWEAGRDPLPATRDVSFACGDVVEEGAEGFEVLLLVSAAFTDALLRTMAAAVDAVPVGTMVRACWHHMHVSCV